MRHRTRLAVRHDSSHQPHFRKNPAPRKHKYDPSRLELLSKLVFRSECLNAVLEDGREVTADEMAEIVCRGAPITGATGAGRGGRAMPGELYGAARALRARHKSRITTFSKKAFLNVVNLCRDICSYCTYKAEPGQQKAVMMSRKQIDDSLGMAKRYGCIEALLVTGERPEERYAAAREWLDKNGFESTADCLVYASEQALDAGLFPHTNAGNLRRSEMAELQKTNVSMGLMLETASERLSGAGMAHRLAPSKRPAERIAVLEEAGRLGIPMTTGLLLGIGETRQEVITSLDVIRAIHRKYGHIQEVILQNFQPKQDTAMRSAPPADEQYFMEMVAACRVMMPDMNIQIPPNLSPDSYHMFLSVGINDWGGISPLTPDFVNPEFPWPEIPRLRQDTEAAGFELECRFPVYPEFVHMIRPDLRDRMAGMAQEAAAAGGGGGREEEKKMLVSREMWQ